MHTGYRNISTLKCIICNTHHIWHLYHNWELIHLDHVFWTHKQRVDVLEPIEFSLVNFTNNIWIIRSKLDGLVSELWREVGQVSLTLQPGPVGRWDLFLLQQSPVYGLQTFNQLNDNCFFPVPNLEEGVSHYFNKARLSVTAQPVRRILVEET